MDSECLFLAAAACPGAQWCARNHWATGPKACRCWKGHSKTVKKQNEDGKVTARSTKKKECGN